ncbi:NrsF family protein [Methyloprofundus sp.]|uniref:NrsF family protein n=1 Tax=Methyloprofundus sp. TaxID=2020875 RepID=UPI003D0F29B7
MTHQNRLDLIKELSTNVPSVRPRGSVLLPAILWFSLNWIYVISLSIYLGPLRPNAIESLLISPQFAFESSIGFISGALFCLIAFQESIPGIRRQWLIYLTYFSALFWISCYVFGLWFPALEPSLIGKRAHCVLEAYLYSIPPLSVAYLIIYRRFPLNSLQAGVFMGIGAGMLPALFMQFSCMYDPQHMLTHHIGPITITVIAGALLGVVFKKQSNLK